MGGLLPFAAGAKFTNDFPKPAVRLENLQIGHPRPALRYKVGFAAEASKQGNDVSYCFPYSDKVFLKEDFVRIGVTDGFGRMHWAPKKQLKSINPNQASYASTDRAKCFCVNLVGGNILEFELGLYVGHETRWSTQEVVSIYILDQIRQERTIHAAPAIIVLSDFVFRTGPTVGNAHLNVEMI